MESQPTYQPIRMHQRFKAKQRALVLLPQGEDALPYHIIDISQGGLSFRYLGKKLKHSEIDRISLYHEYDLIVDSLPVTTVSDSRLHDNLVPVRRGSICFNNLSADQQSKLATFIQQHTEVSH
ncbi:MAG TPA: PilZ domain-containing protein [Malonomonas sp.]